MTPVRAEVNALLLEEAEAERSRMNTDSGRRLSLVDRAMRAAEIITEGAAIVLYLLERHNSSMLPADLSEKAEFLRWLMFDYATLHPAYGKMFAIQYKTKMDENERISVLLQLAGSVSSVC